MHIVCHVFFIKYTDDLDVSVLPGIIEYNIKTERQMFE